MEWVLGACTVLGGIAAIWFFWDKIIPASFGRPNKTNWVVADATILENLRDRYKVKLRRTISHVRLFGNDKNHELNKVFVTLSIAEEYSGLISDRRLMGLMDAGLRSKLSIFTNNANKTSDLISLTGEESSRRIIKPEDLLQPGRHATITGAPGCGKTTLLKYLALQASLRDAGCWIVFLELKTVHEEDLKAAHNLPELLFTKAIVTPLNLNTAEREILRTEFINQLEAGRAFLFLDGLDEVRHQSLFGDLCRIISDFSLDSDFQRNTLILSTRPFGLHRAPLGGLQQMEIQPLNEKQVEAFLENYYPNDEAVQRLARELKKPGDLRDLARVPVLLAGIIELYRDSGVPDLTANRLDIYERITRRLIAKLDQEKNVQHYFFQLDDPEGTLKLDFLQQVAFERLLLDENNSDSEASRFIFSTGDLLAKAKAFVRVEDLQNVSPYKLADDVKATPLLREVSENSYAFAHTTLQEYLAAKRLAKRKDKEGIFCRAYFNSTLVAQEVLPMTLGLVQTGDSLYEALEQLPESLTYTNLRLRTRGLSYAPNISQERFTKLLDRIYQILIKPSNEEENYRRVILKSLWLLTNEARNYLEEKITPNLSKWSSIDKIRVAEALIVLGSEKSFMPLVKALDPRASDGPFVSRTIGFNSLDESLVNYICRALVRINPRQAVSILESIHTSYSYGEIDRLLKQIDTEAAFKALLFRRKRSDWQSSTTIEELSRRSEKKNIIEILINALDDSRDGIRGMAVETLGIIGSKEAALPVSACLRDSHFTVRWKAAKALEQIGSEETVGPLLEALHDKDSTVRWCAARALGDIGSEKALDGLIEALNDSDAEVKYHVASALGRIQSERAVEPLIKLLTEAGDAKSRSSAAYALYNIKSQKALEPLIKCLADPIPEVRAGAAYALGNTRSEKAVKPLTRCLFDQSVEVRRGAAFALGLIGSEKSIPDLIAFLRSNSDGQMREFALKALGEIGSAEVIEPLMESYSYQSHKVAEALAQISIRNFALVLPKLLQHQNNRVRRNTAQIIGYYCNNQSVSNDLSRLVESDPDKEVRRAADEALEKYTYKLNLLSIPIAELEEKAKREKVPPTTIHYAMNIHGDNYGNIQQGGQDNTQSINNNRSNDES